MNFLHITTTMNPIAGGVCKAIRDTIQATSQINNNITHEVLSLDEPENSFITNEKYKIHAIGNKKTNWGFSKNLNKWLKKNYKFYDNIIIHGLWQYQSYSVYKLSKKYNFDYWIMPHGMLDPYFQNTPERKFKAIRNIFFWYFIENKFINNSKGLLFTCEEEKLLARTTFPNYYPKNEFIVGLGVEAPPPFTMNMEKEFKKNIKEWNNKPFILFLSRIHPKKGVDLLIKAYLKLETEILDLPQLIIAGPGLDTEYGKEVKFLSNSSKNIIFSGMLTGESKWGAFYCCDAFILPSHQENFGIAIVEALACEKTVLITDKINIWREIKQSNGGLVNTDTEEGIYKLLKEWVIISDEKKIFFSKSARMTYNTYFTIEQFGKKFLNFF